MYEGHFAEATEVLERSLECGKRIGIPPRARADIMALLGIAALRRGEVDNCIGCLGASSCIFPIAREAVHTRQSGSRGGREVYRIPGRMAGDIRIRWLLNLAYMTLGEYPDRVPQST